MHLSEEQGRKPFPATGWADEEELIIATIQRTESVPRAEAIRRMQRRKKTPRWASFRREIVLAASRMCQNPRCPNGEDGMPAKLDHLRVGTRYCGNACKMQARRSPNHQNRGPKTPVLIGFSRNAFDPLVPPHQENESVLKTKHLLTDQESATVQ